MDERAEAVILDVASTAARSSSCSRTRATGPRTASASSSASASRASAARSGSTGSPSFASRFSPRGSRSRSSSTAAPTTCARRADTADRRGQPAHGRRPAAADDDRPRPRGLPRARLRRQGGSAQWPSSVTIRTPTTTSPSTWVPETRSASARSTSLAGEIEVIEYREGNEPARARKPPAVREAGPNDAEARRRQRPRALRVVAVDPGRPAAPPQGHDHPARRATASRPALGAGGAPGRRSSTTAPRRSTRS